MNSVTKRIIPATIRPDQAEEKRFSAATALFLRKLNSCLKGGKAILGGSGAKGTWLSGNHDMDIFVLYGYSKFKDKSSKLSEFLEAVLKKAFPKDKISRVHGSRDYFKLSFAGFNFEVVPILKISRAEQAVNITDISPLHSRWVNKHAAKSKDDIRLLKQFCKAQNLYGAESYISGFSGYVLEILTAHYGSFEKVLKASLKWKEKDIIDPSRFYKGREALFHINSSKLRSPLIVVDPVDKSRNAAAALSKDKFQRFKDTAKKYLRKPGEDFFEKERLELSVLRDRHKDHQGTILYLEITAPEGKEDVAGAKILKVFECLNKKLDPFTVLASGWDWDKKQDAALYFVLKKKELPEYEIKIGPPLKMKEYVADFKTKNKDTFEDKGRIKAKVKVEHPKIADFAASALKDDYVRERIKRLKTLKVV